MKSQLLILFITAAGIVTPAKAQLATGVKAEDVSMERNGNLMKVDMNLDMSKLKVRKNRAVLITPCLIGAQDSVELKSVGVYGRRRYYYYERNGEAKISGDDEMSYRVKSCPDNIAYEAIVPYSEWQSGAKVTLKEQLYGCCNSILAENATDLTEAPLLADNSDANEAAMIMPELIYKKPAAQQHKMVTFSGSAYVHFPVNQTTINLGYLDNTREIGSISGLIDEIKQEGDVKIEKVTLKGYASPEGSYANNERLAKGRVEALKQYINKLYDFDPQIVQTEYEPEDWDGLRKYVEGSTLANKEGLLSIINSDLEPDARDYKMRIQYPSDYAYLLKNSYPLLRHTDYSISCEVKHYIDPIEIKSILERNPAIVSLNEIYILADTYETGSDEFNSLYEKAVELFPDDEIANLNVANNAIRRNDLDAADEYLTKAGNSAEATYTRGVVAYLKGDRAKAIELLSSAKSAGLSVAAETLSKIQ
jgi:outer membrane protein OmpA-like peptidoglycan-associated protein